MFFRCLCIPLAIALSASGAWASSDNFCEPTWSLNRRGYSHCSTLPMLAPGNDTRANLKLLFVDNGLATLTAKPVSTEDAEFGYGKVPFSLETFERSIFSTAKKLDDGESGYDSAGYGGSSRCVSNDYGKAEFIDAVTTSKGLSAEERKRLIAAREELKPDCADVPAGKVPARAAPTSGKATNGDSPAFRQFMQYIDGATAFYEGRYGDAETHFTALAKDNHPWLKETSLYMLGRTELNLAQQHAFDSYGFPELEKADKKSLQTAEVKFNTYLKAYPSGLYASSARGLLRRVYWMSGQAQRLADEYVWLMDHLESPQRNVSLNQLVEEVDAKLLVSADPKQIKTPLLLAVVDLSLMRSENPSDKERISYSDLQQQQPVFANQKELYEYLLAAHCYYVQRDAAQALKHLSAAVPKKMTYLDFSRLVLRGLALEATKDYAGARKLWLDLLPVAKQPFQAETLQLALALNYEQSTRLDLVFAADSPIKEPAIRSILVRTVTSADLLRSIIKAKHTPAQERQLALYTLLSKDLLLGHYQDYIQDYRLLPRDAARHKPSSGTSPAQPPPLALFTWSGNKSDDSFSCPSTLDTAQKLAKDPKDPHGLICLGDLVYSNDLAAAYSGARSDSDQVELGSSPSQFPGVSFARGDAYKSVIANTAASPDLKAYALYRSIQCYATSGYNHCGGEDVKKSVRKSWFQTLKTRYANTVWAKSLKYYW